MTLRDLILPVTLTACVSSMADVMLTSPAGKLSGEEQDGVVAYRGIPYALPPVGDNRWRSPQPMAPWSGVRDATAYRADCAQAPFPPDAAPIRTQPAEDCLYLNVWQPAEADGDSALPVMVWIHGGGFVNGGTSPAIYSGERFARDGIVFVSMNYRLGRFGFFAHPALKQEGLGANFGLLDQIAALKWVKRNIQAFGGDPDNVTLFGESAGGMSVHILLQSPLAAGLVDKAIIQSGAGRGGMRSTPNMAVAAEIGNQFAPGLSVEELRQLPAEKITGNLNLMTMGQAGYSGPILDGVTVLGTPIEGVKAGLYSSIPVIVGANSADGFPSGMDKDKIFAGYGELEPRARQLYDPTGDLPPMAVAWVTSADLAMIEPARAVADGLAASQPVWLYRFDYVSPKLSAEFARFGAPHASEIPYAFDTVDLRHTPKMVPEESTVANLMHQYWVNFAKQGNPNVPGLPKWPLHKSASGKVQLFDNKGARHVDDPLKERLDFAEQFSSTIE